MFYRVKDKVFDSDEILYYETFLNGKGNEKGGRIELFFKHNQGNITLHFNKMELDIFSKWLDIVKNVSIVEIKWSDSEKNFSIVEIKSTSVR